MSARNKVLLVLCVAVVAVSWAMIKATEFDRSTRYSTSTYSASPWGCKALYLTLQESQLPVKRLRQSYQRLRSHEGVLVITGPLRTPVRGREKTELTNWIKQGNRLIVCDGPLKVPFAQIRETRGAKKSDGLALERMTSPSRLLDLRLRELGDSSHRTFSVALPDMHTRALISVSGESRWEPPPKGWTALIKDHAGPIVISKKLGTGRVIAVSDVTLASNAYIGDQQNLRVILALLLASGRPREILFDEYHQGHAVQDTLWSYFSSSFLAWVLVQGVLAMGLFFFSRRAQYTGRYRSLGSSEGRSTLEYVDSMAGVYESCKAGPVALEALLNRFLGHLSRRTGIPMKTLSESPPDRIAELASAADPDMGGLIRQCRRLTHSVGENQETIFIAKRLAAAGRNIRGAGQR